MGTSGVLGESEENEEVDIPDWYEHIKVAQYLQVPPWDLLDQPVWWLQWGYEAMVAEGKAAEEKNKRAQRHSKIKKR